MGTDSRSNGGAAIVRNGRKGSRVRRTRAERRAIVEETLHTGESVALVARQHGVNANQVFQWRRLYAQGLLSDDDPPQLMAVRIGERSNREGRIELEFAEVRLNIEGAPDLAILRLILDKVLG